MATTIRAARGLAVTVFLAVGCGGSPADNSPDAGTADVDATEQKVDASVAANCDSIPIVAADLEPWRTATLGWFWAQGQSGANAEHQFGDTIHIRGLRMPLDSSELEAGSVAWLLSLPDFPVATAGEVEVVEVKKQFDSATVIIARAKVGATPTRLFRPLASVHLSQSAGDWSARSFTVWASTALMAEPEAIALSECSSQDPPPKDAVLQADYQGLVMRQCAVEGAYSYRPNESDVVEFFDGIEWVVDGESWRARRRARLFVAAQNYWDGIEGADCFCDGVVGFELQVDATSGIVLEYRPGISCVVC